MKPADTIAIALAALAFVVALALPWLTRRKRRPVVVLPDARATVAALDNYVYEVTADGVRAGRLARKGNME